MTPNDAPRVLRMRRVLRQWSHYIGSSVSLHTRFSNSKRALKSRYHLSSFPARHTFSFSSASLIGRFDRLGGAAGALEELESAMTSRC